MGKPAPDLSGHLFRIPRSGGVVVMAKRRSAFRTADGTFVPLYSFEVVPAEKLEARGIYTPT